MLTAPYREYLERAKDALRRLGPVTALNRRAKAYALRRNLRRLAAHYSELARERGFTYSEGGAIAAARQRLRALRPDPVGRRPRVFWVGANRDQDESGFLQALRRCADVVEFRNRTGEYGQWYRDGYGRVRVYDPAIVASNDACLRSQVESALRRDRLDLLMGQMWANYLSAPALAAVRERGVPVVNISMDDRLPDNWSTRHGVRLGAIGLAHVCDLVLTTSSETVSWYGAEGCAAIFWPLASDPDVFAPRDDRERDIDVLFVGNKYGIRESIVRRLVDSGIAVDCFGGGWPNGPATAEQAAALFKRAQIVLGIGTVGYCDDVFTLKLRDFDAPMSGALYITHRCPDLSRLYEEGREIVCYATAAQCAAEIQHYLTHPAELRRIAAAGHAKALSRHTWIHRLEWLFHEIGLATHSSPQHSAGSTLSVSTR